MKKNLLLLLMIAVTGLTAYTQSLSLADSTGPLANNATISRQGHVSDDEIVSFVFVRNNSAQAINVVVKKVEITILPGTLNSFCWGLCFPPNIFVSPPKSIGPLTTDSSDFSGHYNPLGVLGASVVRYVFYDEANPSDSACVNVSFHAVPVGIHNLASKSLLGSAYPNPANSTVSINYTLSTGDAGSILLRNVLGTLVKEIDLSGNEGRVSAFVGDLPEGIYFYALQVDGKAVGTRKLIIRH
jgi:hypothetical protein